MFAAARVGNPVVRPSIVRLSVAGAAPIAAVAQQLMDVVECHVPAAEKEMIHDWRDDPVDEAMYVERRFAAPGRAGRDQVQVVIGIAAAFRGIGPVGIVGE